MAKVLVFSDVHLSSPNSRAKELDKFLKQIEQCTTFDKIIICGDLVNSMDGRLTKHHWAVLSQLRRMSDTIPIILVRGNHDDFIEPLAHLLGIEIVDYYIEDGVFYEHGDRHDLFLADHPWITNIADFFYTWLQKINNNLAKFAKVSSKKFLHCVAEVKKGSLKAAHKHNCSKAVNGHCHHAQVEESYGNCGSWVDDPQTYLIVEDGQISLKYWP